jgi:N-acetylmuramoyl-L-alanine amidase CwlA
MKIQKLNYEVNEMVKIIKMLAPKGSACRPGYALNPEYVTIHNAGNYSKGADADNHGAYLQNSGQYNTVSWHYAVDEKQAVLCIPENENAWHAGDGGNGTGNRKSLAIEICDNSDGDIRKATDNAVELTAYLMKKYNIPLKNLKQHYDWSGKNCPQMIRKGIPYDWKTFVAKVAELLEEPKKEEPKAPATKKPATAAKTYGKAGQLVNLVNVNFYASSDTEKASGKPRKGKYYLWSTEVVNGRIRITNNKKYVGVSGKVTAWINVKDITATKEEELVIKAGAKVVVKDKLYYSSSSQKTSNKTKTGTLYFYDGKAVNGKYRMTSKKEYCGKKPVGMYTTCWMKF